GGRIGRKPPRSRHTQERLARAGARDRLLLENDPSRLDEHRGLHGPAHVAAQARGTLQRRFGSHGILLHQSRRRNTRAAITRGTLPPTSSTASPRAMPAAAPNIRINTAEVGPNNAPDPTASVVSTRTRSTGFTSSAGNRTLWSGSPESNAVAP